MNILLIQAGISAETQSGMGQGNMNRINMPMLGLLYIKACTPPHIHVDIIDEIHGLIVQLKKYDIVGISGMTMHANRIYDLADRYRSLGCYVVLGGIHVSFMVDEALQHADTVMVGEGEETWPRFIGDFERGTPQKSYYSDQQIDLATLPTPNLKEVDGEAYHQPRGTLNSIIATRGCPNSCRFCCVRNMFKDRFRVRPVDAVKKELEGMDDNMIIFQDDNIVGNLAYAGKLFTELIPLNKKWGGQGSINIANNEKLLDLMQKSGCSTLFVGFESINPKNIDAIHKSGVNKTACYAEQIKKIRDRGIKIFGSFIVGLDDDDESVFDDIYDFCFHNKIDFPIVNCLTPFPGTELFTQLKGEGRIADYNWEKYTLTNVVIIPKNMTQDHLQFKYNVLSHYLSKLTLSNLSALIGERRSQ
jgi:radical SAM superfamily enzyme YgiQ (UPF0313 family)